jgi:uncharacterized membrane protein
MDGFGFLFALAGFVMGVVALQKIAKLDSTIRDLRREVTRLTAQLFGQTNVVPEPEREIIPARFREAEEAPANDIAAAYDMAKAGAAKIPDPEVPAPVIGKNWKTNAPKPVKAAAIKKAAAPKKVSPVVDVEEPVVSSEMAKPFVPPPPPPSQPKAPTPRRDMEQAVASRWFVWIGGVAMAIGGLLFVKYAYDNGYISPTLQIFLGLLLAAGLVYLGERARKTSGKTADPDYVPAALSAGGLAIAFGSIYAAYALYELVQPTTAFIGLALVGLAALALSLRQGPLIAALGLVGSYATPTIISSPNPSAWGFFPYLLIIMAASFAVLRKRPWWWLGYATIAGSAIWSLLWIGGPYKVTDVTPVGLFALCFGALSLLGVSGRAILKSDAGSLLDPLHMSVQLKLGSVGAAAASLVLAALVFKSGHAATALVLFFAGMAAISALSWFKRGDTEAVAAAGVLSFIVLMAWREAAFHEWAMDENGMWSSVLLGDAPQFLRWMIGAGLAFTALGIAGFFKKTPILVWAALGAGSAAIFTFGAWARVDALMSNASWVVLAVALAAALLASVWVKRGASVTSEADLAAGVFCVGSAALLLFAADRLFDGVWLSLAVAFLALFYALLTRGLPVKLLGAIAAGFGTLTTIRLFASRELWLDDRALPLGQHWPVYGYGVPIVVLLIASRFLKSSNHIKSATSLEAVSLGLAISLISLEVRVLIGGGVTAARPQLLEIATHVLTWLGAAYGLLYRQKVYSSFVAVWGARILLAGSLATIIAGSLMVLNPLFGYTPIQGGAVFNALLLAYLAPAGLLWLIARRLEQVGLGNWRPYLETFAMFLLTTYVSLEIKRLYAGRVVGAWPRDEIESALHILSWLGLACGLAYRPQTLSALAAKWSASALLAVSGFIILAASLVAFNPVLTHDTLHGNAVFNSLWLTYLAPAAVIWLTTRSLANVSLSAWRPYGEMSSVALVTVFVSLEIKRLYDGPILDALPADELESALLVLAWLCLAFGVIYRASMFTQLAGTWSGRGLLAISAVGIIGASMLAFNPVLTGDTLHGNAVFNSLWLTYLAPAVLLWFLARHLENISMSSWRPYFEMAAVALVTVFVSLEIRRLYTGPVLDVLPDDELESALLVLAWLCLACGVIYRSSMFTPPAGAWSGRGLVALSVLGVVGASLLAYNPVIIASPLHGNVLLNSLLLAYVVPIALLALIVKKLDVIGWQKLVPAFGGLALVLALTYVTLETKRVFQGSEMSPWSQSTAESYAYSAVWLLSALALFVAGIRLQRQYIRYAGLGVMSLVVLKVFAWDMAGLDGIYRILSFFGLGACLIGIGWLYTKYVHQPADPAN